ncbi:hypothetical protein DFH08DRAFT_902975 [Mycena albidolilacea]|uniref:Secreted protein n=1 Tax=Mycena albidolilacea TaxID=1033008 RepID=A0AAD7E9G7_9AGAR|nr:hypothetical protein DFH08DRAFT_902975 [Mycena albidolilacea]
MSTTRLLKTIYFSLSLACPCQPTDTSGTHSSMLSPVAIRFVTDKLWASAPACTAASFHPIISCYIQFSMSSNPFSRHFSHIYVQFQG